MNNKFCLQCCGQCLARCRAINLVKIKQSDAYKEGKAIAERERKGYVKK